MSHPSAPSLEDSAEDGKADKVTDDATGQIGLPSRRYNTVDSTTAARDDATSALPSTGSFVVQPVIG